MTAPTLGIIQKARDQWPAPVEWSSNGMQKWKPNESMQPCAPASTGSTGRQLLRYFRQAVCHQWQRRSMAAAQVVTATSGPSVFVPELARCAHTLRAGMQAPTAPVIGTVAHPVSNGSPDCVSGLAPRF